MGKTSLGKSIARAMHRKFIRISLGGVKDEAEIRGHRRTYVGAMPGKIIQGLKQAGTANPVFMIDEVDKLGGDYKGDPSSALLEVLDPEQNDTFTDHYIKMPVNLSDIMFIATSNILETIPDPLRDRMEVVHLSGYTTREKIIIAKRYLIPKQLKDSGMKPGQIRFSDNAIKTIIERYTREAGLRNLEREIARICRKAAVKIAEGKKGNFSLTASNVKSYLGRPIFTSTAAPTIDQVGVVTGLAWTRFGGEILQIESVKMKGRDRLRLTGHLGEIMKESAQTALGYIRANALRYDIDDAVFDNSTIHIHIPEGAIPKDGPSAGITLAASVLSALSGKRIRKDTAMTGEITLTGRVLAVGGIKEKVLAAARSGIYRIIMPKDSEGELELIPRDLKNRMTFILVSGVDEAFENIFI